MTTFDPVKYKETTREQWQTAAEAWSDYGPFLRRWLGPATELMLDMTHVRGGSHVLDVAAGAGDQSLHFFGVDLGPNTLSPARCKFLQPIALVESFFLAINPPIAQSHIQGFLVSDG